LSAASVSKTATIEPMAACSPGSPWIDTTLPVTGLVISMVALSVMTSTRGWSSWTRSPTLTCQVTISASAMPSPTSGSLKEKRPMVVRPP
jgi:hypothetical protein